MRNSIVGNYLAAAMAGMPTATWMVVLDKTHRIQSLQPALDYNRKLAPGDSFKFTTHKGREGYATVIRREDWRKHPVYVKWTDKNGDHYEWFHESEFSSIMYWKRNANTK